MKMKNVLGGLKLKKKSAVSYNCHSYGQTLQWSYMSHNLKQKMSGGTLMLMNVTLTKYALKMGDTSTNLNVFLLF